jgi:hypothetical protein
MASTAFAFPVRRATRVPSFWPRALAAASAALVRSEMSARSLSAGELDAGAHQRLLDERRLVRRDGRLRRDTLGALDYQ